MNAQVDEDILFTIVYHVIIATFCSQLAFLRLWYQVLPQPPFTELG